MENIKFLGAANEVQKIYNDLGLLVPVGDLSTGKAPAVQVLPSTSTLDSITFNFNVTSSADITSIAYETSSQQTGTITPKKGVVSVTFDSLDYNTELEIRLAVTNASGTTTVTTIAETQHYTDWAEPESVLAGNKFIADGVEMVGEIVIKDSTDLTVNERTVTVPAGYYAENASASVSSDYIIPTGSTTITNNGTDINIAQYATVDVAVPVGPGTGGATIQSVVMSEDEWQPGAYDFTVTLDALPSDIDTANHNYKVVLYAQCYNYDAGDLGGHLHDAMISDINQATYLDIENNIISEPYASAPEDDQSQTLLSTSGYVILYQDTLINPIYKWPCTVTVTQP